MLQARTWTQPRRDVSQTGGRGLPQGALRGALPAGVGSGGVSRQEFILKMRGRSGGAKDGQSQSALLSWAHLGLSNNSSMLARSCRQTPGWGRERGMFKSFPLRPHTWCPVGSAGVSGRAGLSLLSSRVLPPWGWPAPAPVWLSHGGQASGQRGHHWQPPQWTDGETEARSGERDFSMDVRTG